MAEDSNIDNNNSALLNGSDITPHVYEGGFKTWECSIDLAEYVSTAFSDIENNNIRHIVEVNNLNSFVFLNASLSIQQARSRDSFTKPNRLLPCAQGPDC